MVRITKEQKQFMMQNFINEAENEIQILNLDDDINVEEYNYDRDGWSWYIKKHILPPILDIGNQNNLIEIRIKKSIIDTKMIIKGDVLDESCWVYKANTNKQLGGKDCTFGKANSKIQNGLSYLDYNFSKFT